MAGKVIYTDNFNLKINVNTENFAKGTYLIDVKNTQGIFSKKITIK